MRADRSTSDYTPVAAWYDATRNMPDELLVECFARFAAATRFPPRQRILDAGCGTAQLSLPLIRDGHSVIGVDVSEAMLAHARAKMQPGWQAQFQVGDVRELPFPDDCFDATVVSKLFQHVPGWQTAVDEIRRVTRPGGYLLHINEKGAFRNKVRERFAVECDQRGLTDRYHGLRDRTDLGRYVQDSGAARVHLDVSGLTWSKELTYGEALRHLELRLHSEFWALTDRIYDDVLAAVRRWVDAQPRGASTVERISPYLTAEIFRWAATP
jgi:ubiquinone/menaquinone biosynthesis C-methylase UbiE